MQTQYRKRTKITDKDLRFRCPEELLKDVEGYAMKNGRSRNAEILERLAKSLESETKHVGKL
jgi:hypothetical protein